MFAEIEFAETVRGPEISRVFQIAVGDGRICFLLYGSMNTQAPVVVWPVVRLSIGVAQGSRMNSTV